MTRTNVRVKCGWSAKPAFCAMVVMDSSPTCEFAHAHATRRRLTYSPSSSRIGAGTVWPGAWDGPGDACDSRACGLPSGARRDRLRTCRGDGEAQIDRACRRTAWLRRAARSLLPRRAYYRYQLAGIRARHAKLPTRCHRPPRGPQGTCRRRSPSVSSRHNSGSSSTLNETVPAPLTSFVCDS